MKSTDPVVFTAGLNALCIGSDGFHSLFKEYHTCARSFSLLPLLAPLSLSPLARKRRLTKPPLKLLTLLRTPLTPLRALLTPLRALLTPLLVLLRAPLTLLLVLLRAPLTLLLALLRRLLTPLLAPLRTLLLPLAKLPRSKLFA